MKQTRSARRRHRRRAGGLTALLDVLFILLFAALVQAQELVEMAEKAPANRDQSGAHESFDMGDDTMLEDAASFEQERSAAIFDGGALLTNAPFDSRESARDAGRAAGEPGNARDAGRAAGEPGNVQDTIRAETRDAGVVSDHRERPDESAGDGDSADAGVDETLVQLWQRKRTGDALSGLVAGGVRGRDVITLVVSQDGKVSRLAQWRDGAVVRDIPLGYRLLREVPAQGAKSLTFSYRGDAREEHRLCALALREFEPPRENLEGALVVIGVDSPLRELALALRDGVMSDAGRCFQDTGGIAVLLDPASALSARTEQARERGPSSTVITPEAEMPERDAHRSDWEWE